ncbi:DUF2975 domain-containing protein [Aeromicrobium sp. Marseille-Q0843]|uniref:DUF2975 domain-containing protein n=1 Tax=Aeromicrobium phoceense TaxID=2754045 RepID=A0A838XG38_9ACTN|nr:DUF2975 domain-containing protein [Aeromicrobium phoceense]MBA4608992.1 DUF2975 domain-containing protein [Aeromicrobium phoceense]
MKAPFGTATRSDLWLAVALAAAVIVGTAIDAARRVVEILPNRDVPVEVYFESQQQAIAITGLSEPVRVDLDHATIRVSDLAPASYVSAIAAVVVPALAVIGVMVCISWLCRNLAGSVFFSRTNTRLVTATSLLIVGGWMLSSLARTMASNGALATVSPEAADVSVTMQFSLMYLFIAIIVGSLAAAFHAGERMQRDAEGLV